MAQLVESKSIYHGLPVMPDELTGLTAIVTGANGISGDYMLRVLCESPRRWSKIYALSRRPPHGTWPAHVQHVSVDLLRPAEEVAAELQRAGVAGDYVFFFAYVQPPAQGDGGIWSAADELVRLNRRLNHPSSPLVFTARRVREV
ncbi:hypothetical protein CDD83_882 [Cordyceps sp. RAO-2017]|nr:hypothetical protein CDD83_882 [Cordyceps sp. RAO-2017]